MSRIKFQLGSVSGKQAAAVTGLVCLLWMVFPGSKSEPTKDRAASSGSSVETGEPSTNPEPVTAEQANASTVSNSTSGTGDALPVRLEDQRTPIPASRHIGKPYEPLAESDVEYLASASPFKTAAIDAALLKKSTGENETTAEPPADRHRRILQGKAAGANVSLVYSSSHGTRATVINREILKPGMTTSSGLEVHGVHDEGVRVRLQPGSERDATASQEDSDSSANSNRQN